MDCTWQEQPKFTLSYDAVRDLRRLAPPHFIAIGNASIKFLGTNGQLVAPLVGTRRRRFKSCHSGRHLAKIDPSSRIDCGTVSSDAKAQRSSEFIGPHSAAPTCVGNACRQLCGEPASIFRARAKTGCRTRDSGGDARVGQHPCRRAMPQLNRASDYESGGQKFESFRARHLSC